MPRKLCIAMDNVGDKSGFFGLATLVQEHVDCFKIGLESFTKFGPSLIEAMVGSGKEVFLDLKLHDIPNTVGQAMRAIGEMGVHYTTVHASGGSEMIAEATSVANDFPNLRVLAVTVLTSLGGPDLDELGFHYQGPGDFVEQQTRRLVNVAKGGTNSFVCPVAMNDLVRGIVPNAFVVNPGIRLPAGDTHDQKQVATPQLAVEKGTSMIVVGRAITQAGDPAAAAKMFKDLL